MVAQGQLILATQRNLWSLAGGSFLVVAGKGGTGNTKRHAEAVTAMMLVGFEGDRGIF